MKWENRGHEYDELAKNICDGNTKYYLWGIGILGESFYNDFSKRISIIGFIDSNPLKQGKWIDGVYVYTPDEFVLKENEKIIIATGWVKQVSDILVKRGYKKNEDFYLLDNFSTIYMMYKYNELHLEKVDMFCNTVCSLKCKHCSALMPYQKNGRNYSLSEMKDNVDLIFKWVDYMHILSFSGGDAMLNPNLIDIIKYTGEKYKGRKVQDFELYTNAIIMPSKEMLEVWKKYNVIIRFTNYTKNVPQRQKIYEMINLLRENNLKYDYVQFEKWLDMGYPQETNGILTDAELIGHCKECSPVISSCLNKGKLFYCSPSCAAAASGLFEHEEEGFSLLDYNENRKRELMEFYTGYSEKGYPEYCKRCNGFFNNNNMLIEVAEQL